MVPYYHITPYKNIDSIMRQGLVPQIGNRSTKQQEEHPAVFLFNDRVSVEDAIMNWYGDEFDDGTKFAVIQIHLPKCMLVNLTHCTVVGYESKYHGVIDPRWITHIQII